MTKLELGKSPNDETRIPIETRMKETGQFGLLALPSFNRHSSFGFRALTISAQ